MGKIITNCNDLGYMKLFVKHGYDSYQKKRWFGPEYQLIINSEYFFSQLRDGAEIVITREKICFKTSTYYDRFFVYCNLAILTHENHFVSNAENLIDIFKKKKKKDIIWELVSDLLIFTPGGLLLVGKILNIIYGWKIKAIYLVILYTIMILLFAGMRWIFWHKTDKKEMKEFTTYFTNEYIINYYATPERKACFGEIERE